LHRFPASVALLLGALALSGCAADGTPFGPNALTTSAVPTPPPTNPACLTLSSEIDALRKEGVADKIEKAASKKYKMTAADLKKADQLTKANADFQTKCSTLPPKPVTAQASSSPPQAANSASVAPAPKTATAPKAAAQPAVAVAPAKAQP